MSVKELKFECLEGKLYTFAGQIILVPIVEKIGDAIGLDHSQAHLLYLFLKERFGE